VSGISHWRVLLNYYPYFPVLCGVYRGYHTHTTTHRTLLRIHCTIPFLPLLCLLYAPTCLSWFWCIRVLLYERANGRLSTTGGCDVSHFMTAGALADAWALVCLVGGRTVLPWLWLCHAISCRRGYGLRFTLACCLSCLRPLPCAVLGLAHFWLQRTHHATSLPFPMPVPLPLFPDGRTFEHCLPAVDNLRAYSWASMTTERSLPPHLATHLLPA